MRLTGKAEEQFEKWAIEQEHLEKRCGVLIVVGHLGNSIQWRNLPESMQWGIYQDWADSIGIQVFVRSGTITETIGCKTWVDWFYIMRNFDKVIVIDNRYGYQTRQEARNAAIDKLNEIVNGQELTIKDQ